ncbi:unnamed protein product, partial [Meganyctiphanes norvegica]
MKTFTNQSHCTAHQRIHTGDKQYKISNCEKVFSKTNSAETHMRTHIIEKQYQSSCCNNSFSKNTNHKTDLKTHNGKNIYQCNDTLREHELEQIDEQVKIENIVLINLSEPKVDVKEEQ